MPFLSSKNVDALLDVPNLECPSSRSISNKHKHREEGGESRGCRSRSGSSCNNGGSIPILPQIDTRLRKRPSANSVTGDEVSVLSLHSAFRNMPIQEDAELADLTANRSVSSFVHQNNQNNSYSNSNSYNYHNNSKIHQYQTQGRNESASTISFSEKSLPIMASDIESIEQNWITNQQQQQKQRDQDPPSSKSTSSKNSKRYYNRRLSTQTYSDKGTVYSSIYKTFCDEQSARSVASASIPKHEVRKGGTTRTFSFCSLSSGTVGTARQFPRNQHNDNHHQHPSSTSNTSKTASSTSTAMNQFEDISLPSSFPAAPTNTPKTEITPFLSNMQNIVEGNIITRAVSTLTKEKRVNETVKPSSKASQMGSNSGSGAEESTVMMKNNDNVNGNSNGRPPLSKSSSSSSITDGMDQTSESQLQKEMYRLSLELASTLSTLDFSKLEITKYAKQVSDLQATVQNLETEREALKKKLERYEQKAKIKQEKESKENEKKEKKDLAMDVQQESRNGHSNDIPRCITPLNNEGGDNHDHAPDLTFSRDDDNDDNGIVVNRHSRSIKKRNQRETKDESHLLFPELNESHLTCSDLYSSHVLDNTIDASKLHDRTHTPSKLLDEIEEFCDPDDEENEFPSLVLDSGVSLIDPREEVFNDDPFATVYKDTEPSIDEEKDREKEYKEDIKEDVPAKTQIVNPSPWIPNLKKKDDNENRNQFKMLKKDDKMNQSSMTINHFSRFLRFGNSSSINNFENRYDEMNSSMRSVKTNMTAPVSSKQRFFRFGRL